MSAKPLEQITISGAPTEAGPAIVAGEGSEAHALAVPGLVTSAALALRLLADDLERIRTELARIAAALEAR